MGDIVGGSGQGDLIGGEPAPVVKVGEGQTVPLADEAQAQARAERQGLVAQGLKELPEQPKSQAEMVTPKAGTVRPPVEPAAAPPAVVPRAAQAPEPIGDGRWAAYIKTADGSYDMWLFRTQGEMEAASNVIRASMKSDEQWGRTHLPKTATMEAIERGVGAKVTIRTFSGGKPSESVSIQKMQADVKALRGGQPVSRQPHKEIGSSTLPPATKPPEKRKRAARQPKQLQVPQIARQRGDKGKAPVIGQPEAVKPRRARKDAPLTPLADDPRSPHAIAIDNALTAQNITTDKDRWGAKRNRIDLEGQDMPKTKQAFPRSRAFPRRKPKF